MIRDRERRVEDLGRERSESRLVRRDLAGQRHGHERAAVEAAAERNDAGAPRVRTRDLDRVLDRLGAGRHEDGLLRRWPRRQLVQLLGKLDRAIRTA